MGGRGWGEGRGWSEGGRLYMYILPSSLDEKFSYVQKDSMFPLQKKKAIINDY